MKTISPGMSSHLSEEVTTLCTCWKIVRQDGAVFGFTDHDMDLTFLGVTYESETGYNRTAIRSDASFSVDNLDVTGFLESDRISENDLRNGLFDFANVYIFAVNWADLTMADLKLRRGWFGEVTLNQNGMFETEIRGLHQALSVGFMESYQPECRADFCDTRCKLVYADFVRPVIVGEDAISRSQFIVGTGSMTPFSDSVGAHQYWRIKINKIADPDTGAASVGEFTFYDQTDTVITGGTASASSNYPGFVPALGHDGTLNAWATDASDTHGYWQIDFGSPKDVKTVSIAARNDGFYNQTPTGFTIYYSDDGVTWTNTHRFTTPNWTAPAQTRSFTQIGGGVVTISPPDPEEGASTYVGGTLKFTSGPNTGKIIEIVSYDPATGLVTLFENFPYEVSVGDQAELNQGCDKMFATCKLYSNQVNFRGEPHVPGQDELLNYPDAHD